MRAARSTSKVQQDLPCLILSLLQSLKAKQGKSEQQQQTNKPKNPTKKPPQPTQNQTNTNKTPHQHFNIFRSSYPSYRISNRRKKRRKMDVLCIKPECVSHSFSLNICSWLLSKVRMPVFRLTYYSSFRAHLEKVMY